MKKMLIPSLVFISLAGFFQTSYGQFTEEELAARTQIENFLKTAEIIRHEDVGEGVTKPKRLYLQKGDQQMTGLWKNPRGTDRGYREGWEYEIAAYRMDKLLKINMIPPTVERRFRGRRGSLQCWVPDLINRLDIREQNLTIPENMILQCERMTCLQRAFDSLIANIDRTFQNTTFTKDWRLILIDHSRAFRFNRIYVDQLLYGKYGLRKQALCPLPKEFVQRVRGLNSAGIRGSVGPYLKNIEIQAILKRSRLLLKEIDELVRINGIENILY